MFKSQIENEKIKNSYFFYLQRHNGKEWSKTTKNDLIT